MNVDALTSRGDILYLFYFIFIYLFIYLFIIFYYFTTWRTFRVMIMFFFTKPLISFKVKH
ncbi:MAG: hypothetical protein N7Q72_02140 [Spiroplasma sp. Tabriz.8]|nr:hypothetical protein [Spiroplasma sp. Tabriz.8]